MPTRRYGPKWLSAKATTTEMSRFASDLHLSVWGRHQPTNWCKTEKGVLLQVYLVKCRYDWITTNYRCSWTYCYTWVQLWHHPTSLSYTKSENRQFISAVIPLQTRYDIKDISPKEIREANYLDVFEAVILIWESYFLYMLKGCYWTSINYTKLNLQ